MILGGTRSTFGEQNQSIRLTAPAVGFGTSGRTDKVYNEATETLNLGKNSPGAAFSSSGFGIQPSSKNPNAPAYHMGARYELNLRSPYLHLLRLLARLVA